MPNAALIFPHQLFENHPALEHQPDKVLLIEHPLFFGDLEYPARMHKQKLAFHRATMAVYQKQLKSNGHQCLYVSYDKGIDPLADIFKQLASDEYQVAHIADVHDNILQRRLAAAAGKHGIELSTLATPGFINQSDENIEWRQGRKRWFMADFYQWQRLRLDVLISDGKPVGGQWSFDEDNRRKLPKKLLPEVPKLPSIQTDDVTAAAIKSVNKDFGDNPGHLDQWYYPITPKDAQHWLDQFLTTRFQCFGDYEDAIVEDHNWLYHSVLTPMLNVGLLTPEAVVKQTLRYAENNDTPLNSVEGFIRQIIGWREFMRATYEDLGVQMRTTNHWQHTRPLPASFYDGTTGILPVDNAIGRILQTGYCHHIERLMVLGGFMFLCEIDPDDIYRWFMEMFIDSYDWVMVPNVYAMSQHADGGNITTKPYFSGSNYVIKMSHYKKGSGNDHWSEIWDGLFWRWIIKNSAQLQGNPRWVMMVRNAEKMDSDKKATHLAVAEKYLKNL